MSLRSPSRTLIVDANIVVSVAIGLRSRPAFNEVQARRSLWTSERACQEMLRRVSGLAGKVERASDVATQVLHLISIADERLYRARLDEAEHVLRLAVPSRNGSVRDAHILALAWTLDADIWSHDRDFAGTGWPSWSNANLRAALARENAA